MKRKAEVQTVDLGTVDGGTVRGLVRVREFSNWQHSRRFWLSASMDPEAVLVDRRGGQLRRIDLPKQGSNVVQFLAPVALYIAARRIFGRRRRSR